MTSISLIWLWVSKAFPSINNLKNDLIKAYRSYLSVELTHVEFMGIGSFDYWVAVENIFEFDFVESSQIALQSYVIGCIQRKEDRSPGILSGSAKVCLSCLSIMGMALP